MLILPLFCLDVQNTVRYWVEYSQYSTVSSTMGCPLWGKWYLHQKSWEMVCYLVLIFIAKIKFHNLRILLFFSNKLFFYRCCPRLIISALIKYYNKLFCFSLIFGLIELKPFNVLKQGWSIVLYFFRKSNSYELYTQDARAEMIKEHHDGQPVLDHKMWMFKPLR